MSEILTSILSQRHTTVNLAFKKTFFHCLKVKVKNVFLTFNFCFPSRRHDKNINFLIIENHHIRSKILSAYFTLNY